MIPRLVGLGLITIFLLIFTIVAQREKRAWAWARFILFEMNLALILINLAYWTTDPFSPLQIVSWVVLAASLFMLFQGVWLLITRGKPKGYFERTTELVSTGIYRFIRHPMYASLFYLTVGTVLKNPSLVTCALGLVSIAAAIATARIEERDNLTKFGPAYEEYMQGTRMFVPFAF